MGWEQAESEERVFRAVLDDAEVFREGCSNRVDFFHCLFVDEGQCGGDKGWFSLCDGMML